MKLRILFALLIAPAISCGQVRYNGIVEDFGTLRFDFGGFTYGTADGSPVELKYDVFIDFLADYDGFDASFQLLEFSIVDTTLTDIEPHVRDDSAEQLLIGDVQLDGTGFTDFSFDRLRYYQQDAFWGADLPRGRLDIQLADSTVMADGVTEYYNSAGTHTLGMLGGELRIFYEDFPEQVGLQFETARFPYLRWEQVGETSAVNHLPFPEGGVRRDCIGHLDERACGFEFNVWFENPAVAGDSNSDGLFDSADLVRVFSAGQYEDGIEGNSGWRDGDWNGDREFDTQDLVFAFQGGLYESEAASVPEPIMSPSWLLGALLAIRRHGHKSQTY